MNYIVCFTVDNETFHIVTNSSCVKNYLLHELWDATCSNEFTPDLCDGYIEIRPQQSEYGQFAFSEHNVINGINGKKRLLQLFSLKSMQPIRIFVNHIISIRLVDRRIPIHASTICLDNKGIMFCGIKNSGKSSLSLASVLWHNCKFLTDDISFIDVKDDNDVCSVLRGIHIGCGEISLIKNKFLIKKDFLSTPERKDRIILNKDYCCKKQKINHIVFPILQNESKYFSVFKLSVDDAAKKLMENSISFGNNSSCFDMDCAKQIINNIDSAFIVHIGTDIDFSCNEIITFIS